jgi:hypothetical protein
VVDTVLAGSMESDGRLCVGAFGTNLASVACKMFSYFIYILKIL